MALFYDCNDASVRAAALSSAAHCVRPASWSCCPPTPSTASAPTPSTRPPSPTCSPPRAAAATCRCRCSSVRGTRSRAWSASVAPRTWDLIEAFWPGGLTLVVEQAPSLSWDLGDARGTVAVRMPLHPVAIELLESTGPMAVSSANRSGQPAGADGGGGAGPARRRRRGLSRRRPGADRRRLHHRRRHRPRCRASCAPARSASTSCAPSSRASRAERGSRDATHPSLEYLLVAAVAAAGCFLRDADRPRDRGRAGARSPGRATATCTRWPSRGWAGVALFAGLALALFAAAPAAHAAGRVRRNGPEIAVDRGRRRR